MALLEFPTAEISRRVENGLVRSSNRPPEDTRDRDPAGAFDYLLGDPRRARRLRHMNTAGIMALVTIAMVLYVFI
jgi:hypothetical protein